MVGEGDDVVSVFVGDGEHDSSSTIAIGFCNVCYIVVVRAFLGGSGFFFVFLLAFLISDILRA